MAFSRRLLPRQRAALGAALAIAIGVGSCTPDADACPQGSVLNAYAGTCSIPDELLVVSNDREAVESAVAEHGGKIVETIASTHSIRFPIDDLDALERIRAALSAEGFEVRYSVVVTSFEGN